MSLTEQRYLQIQGFKEFIMSQEDLLNFNGEYLESALKYKPEEEANALRKENEVSSKKYREDYEEVIKVLQEIDLNTSFDNLSIEDRSKINNLSNNMPKLNYSIFTFQIDYEESQALAEEIMSKTTDFGKDIDKKITSSNDNKKITLVLGQTAAGKSFSLSEEAFRKENFTVDTDEYREFHPGIKTMQRVGAGFFEINSFNLTHNFASHINTLARTKMEEEQKEIVTDTVDLDWWMTDEFERYKKMGYEIDLKVIVTNPIISRFSKGLRYLQEIEKESFGRYVTDEDHDVGLKGIKETVADLNNGEGIGKIDNISLFAGQKETIISDTNKISDIFQDLSEIPVSEQKWLSSKLGEFYLLYKKHSKKMDKNIKKELLANYEILKSELEIPELGEEKKIVNPPKI